MNHSRRLQTAKILLILNTIFWIIIALVSSFSNLGDGTHSIIKALLFLEAVFYGACTYGIYKKIKWVYLFSLVFTFGNTILSITDEIDLSDIVSLLLSLLTFLSLISIWKTIMKGNDQRSSYDSVP